MRLILVLSLLVSPLLAGGNDIAERFPAGATVYLEGRGLAGKLDALLASPLGRAVREHPAVAAFFASPQGRQALMGEAFLQGATGMDLRGLVRAIASDRVGLAVYGSPDRVVVLARMPPDTAERLLGGVEVLAQTERLEVAPADEQGPALWQLGPAFVCLDGNLLAVSTDQILAMAVRTRSARGVLADDGVAEARHRVGPDADLFGFVELEPFRAELRKGGKPRDLGAAILAGAFAHVLPDAEWVGFGASLKPAGNDWKLDLRGYVPAPGDVAEPVAKSYLGTLEALPFALPEHTLGVVRMHRDLEAVWSNRDALIAERGLADLVQFETNFGNLTGGMSWVEEFLPNIGDELIVIGTRRVYAPGEQAPAVRYPQGAVLWPVKDPQAFEVPLQLAFQTLVFILNQQSAQMNGTPLINTTKEYKGVKYHASHFMAPHPAEMEGRTGLPERYNFAPSAGIVSGYLVIASTEAVLRDLIDAGQGATPAPAGVNAGVWLRPAEIRELLAENREALVADTMLKKGDDRATAENKIDLALDVGRMLRSVSLVSEETRGALGLHLVAVLGPAPAE